MNLTEQSNRLADFERVLREAGHEKARRFWEWNREPLRKGWAVLDAQRRLMKDDGMTRPAENPKAGDPFVSNGRARTTCDARRGGLGTRCRQGAFKMALLARKVLGLE